MAPVTFQFHVEDSILACKNKFPYIHLSGVPISIYYYTVETLELCSFHNQTNTSVIENNEYEVKEAIVFNIPIIGYCHGRVQLIWPISSWTSTSICSITMFMYSMRPWDLTETYGAKFVITFNYEVFDKESTTSISVSRRFPYSPPHHRSASSRNTSFNLPSSFPTPFLIIVANSP